MALTVAALRAVPLLSELKEKELRSLVNRMRERSYGAGETVMKEGTAGIGFFMILDGSADVVHRGEKRATLTAGDFFGELGLLNDGAVRSATILAQDGLRTAAMPSWEFKTFVREHPEVAWTLLCTMAARVAAAQRQDATAAAS